MRRQPTFTRADRLEHLMADEVDRLVSYELRSPLAQQVKIVAARLSPDLGHLRVGYVLHDGREGDAAVQAMLEQAASYVARTLGETLQLKKRVEVAFHFDRDAMRQQRVDKLLAEEAARRAATPPETPETPAAPAGPDTHGPDTHDTATDEP